jgi:uncharacterized protein
MLSKITKKVVIQGLNKTTIARISIVVVVLAVLAAFALFLFLNRPKKIALDFQVLEKAVTLSKRQKGLSNRQDMCDQCGMLFIFPSKAKQTFWMKETYVDIDILFLSSDLKVVTHIISPKKDNTELVYESKEEVDLVLEIPSKEAKKLEIKEGDYLSFSY